MSPLPRLNTNWLLSSDPSNKLAFANRDTPSAWLPHSSWPTSNCKLDLLHLLLLLFIFLPFISTSIDHTFCLILETNEKSKSCQDLASYPCPSPLPNPRIQFLFPAPTYLQKPELNNFIYPKLSFVNKIIPFPIPIPSKNVSVPKDTNNVALLTQNLEIFCVLLLVINDFEQSPCYHICDMIFICC